MEPVSWGLIMDQEKGITNMLVVRKKVIIFRIKVPWDIVEDRLLLAA